MANGSPYMTALLRARLAMGALETQAVLEVQAVLTQYANTLEAIIRAGGANPNLEVTRRAVMAASAQLDQALAASVARGRNVSFQQVLTIWRQAQLQVAALEGVSGALLGTIRFPAVSMLGQLASLQAGNHWRTIVRANSINAGREATRIIGLALQEGVGPEELARRLRQFVTGSEPFAKAFEEVQTRSGKVFKIDLRKLNAAERFAARTMRNSAMRIAVSERHNARSEAEIQHMMVDPFVEAVQWRLSANRSFSPTSSFTPPDVCDYLAVNDVWGLGPGVYPVTNVPPPPHAYDRCEKIPIPRTAAQMQDPKPTGVIPIRSGVVRGGHVPNMDRITPERVAKIREQAWAAIDFGVQGYPARRASA